MDSDLDVIELGDLLQDELDRAGEVVHDGRHVDALLDNDVKVDREVPIWRDVDVDATTEAVGWQELRNTSLLVDGRHAYDAISLKRGIASQVCDAVVRHLERSRNDTGHGVSSQSLRRTEALLLT